MAQNKISYYEQAFRLHHENAALRKKIESLEQGQGIPALVASHEKELRKKDNAIKKIQREPQRYHDLWQHQVALNRMNGIDEEGEEILALRKENLRLKKDNELLKKQLDSSLELVKKLKAQIGCDFENSSLPSSAKPFHKKIHNSRVRSGRRPGGQAGHTVQIMGNAAIVDNDFDRAPVTSYTWVYSDRLKKSGWVNSRFI